MKKRTAFIGAILSLIPLGQSLLIGTGAALISSAVIHSLSAKAETKNANFYYDRGVIKYDKGNYKGALSDYTKAIEINPYKDPYAYSARGYAKYKLKDYKGAISDFTEAIKINPKYIGDAYSGRGYAKLYLKDYKGAISDFTEGLKINPKDGYAYKERGYAKTFLKDYEGAMFDHNKGLEIIAKNNKNKVKLSTKDILYTDVSSDPLLRGFNKYAGFDGNTYTRPITYYIHDKNGKLNSKLLPKDFKKTYEHSLDEEKFIVNFISKIDKFIDLDFKRVYSKTDAMIRIYKTNITEDNYGAAYDNGDGVPDKWFRLDVAWGDSPFDIPKLKKYPTLSVDNAYTIVHELGHALGLAHFDKGCGKYCKSNFDPKDMRINSKKTVMSYNNFLYSVDDMFVTEFDLKALKQVWGIEKDN